MRLFLLLLTLLAPIAINAVECTGNWERFSNDPLVEIALPDTHVTYWRYRFEVRDRQPIVLRVRGNFPRARYMNFNVYDQETLDSTGALTDFRMAADEGATNTFLPGADRTAKSRSYTAWVIPQSMKVSETRNVLKMPEPIPDGEPKLIELWYRVYAPDENLYPNGGEELPKIEAFADTSATIAVECPAVRRISAPLWRAVGNLPPKDANGALRTYASKPSTMYANFDTRYVAAALNFRKGEVAVLRFKAPTFPGTFRSGRTVETDRDVRYWSICLGGASTRTADCLADYQMKIGSDGWVNVVIADPELEPRIRALNLNYLPKPTFLVPIFIYRNLLASPGFTGDFNQVKRWDGVSKLIPDAALRLDAANFIGDYAPRGRHCRERDFFDDYCGMTLSFPKEER